MKKIVSIVITFALLMFGILFFNWKDDVPLSTGGFGPQTSGDDVICVAGSITQIRFHREVAPLGIDYDDAFNYTQSQCEAYNLLTTEEKQQLQINRVEDWLADLSARKSYVGNEVVSEAGDPQ